MIPQGAQTLTRKQIGQDGTLHEWVIRFTVAAGGSTATADEIYALAVRRWQTPGIKLADTKGETRSWEDANELPGISALTVEYFRTPKGGTRKKTTFAEANP